MNTTFNRSGLWHNTRALFRRVCFLAFSAFLLTSATELHAQCSGDCNNDSQVSMSELVAATEAALGRTTACSAADPAGDGVTIEDLVVSVNQANTGCPQATPTPSATPTPTRTLPVATRTPTMSVTGCGDGVVDFVAGETCDDNNTEDGDSCPANCRIATCVLSGESVEVDVTFAVPGSSEVVGVQMFVRYPDGVLGIPGRLGSAQVFDRLSDAPDNVILQPNDLDYGLIMVAFSFDNSTIVPGRLFRIRFDRCQGARMPMASDFYCQVNGAGDAAGANVAGVTCDVLLP